jgi:hypothetical protein
MIMNKHIEHAGRLVSSGKPVLRLVVMLVFAAAVFADPLWYPDPSLLYPQERYITALGIGDTESEARTVVMSGIAQYFHSSIQAEEETLIQYNSAISSSTLRKTRLETSREEQMKTSVSISSVAEFRGIRFATPVHLPGGEWAALGFIDKAESLQVWEMRTNNNRVLVNSLVGAGERQRELLYRYSYMKQAAAIARLLIADVTACSGIVSSDKFAETLNFARQVIENYNAIRASMTFEIRIEGDRNGQLKNRLSGLLSRNQYIVVPRNALYAIEGEITASELTMPAGLFVRIGAELRIVNRNGAVLHSFTIPQKREGAYDWDSAYIFGFRYLGRYMEDNLIAEIAAFIDG